MLDRLYIADIELVCTGLRYASDEAMLGCDFKILIVRLSNPVSCLLLEALYSRTVLTANTSTNLNIIG